MYSLMGAGDYGNACMNLPISFHMRKTFALPRMLYSLEISKLRHSDTVYEPRHEKTNALVSDQVRHKPGCAVTEDG